MAAMTRASSTVVMEMPDVSKQPGAFTKGGPSLDIAISPDARALLNLDTQSLARKGYSSVNIDTDGRPGAEITVDLTSATTPASVMVAGGGTKSDPMGLLSQLKGNGSDSQDPLDLLMEIIGKLAEELGEAQDKDPLDALLDSIKSLAKKNSSSEEEALGSLLLQVAQGDTSSLLPSPSV